MIMTNDRVAEAFFPLKVHRGAPSPLERHPNVCYSMVHKTLGLSTDLAQKRGPWVHINLSSLPK